MVNGGTSRTRRDTTPAGPDASPRKRAGDDAPASRRVILADADGLATQKPHVANHHL